MTAADIVALPLGVIGLGVGLYRLINHRRFEAMHLTALSLALGIGVLVRSPWLGDDVLDSAIGELTGWWNVPDMAGHIATFVAMGAALGFFARALGMRSRLWTTYTVLGVFCAVCVVVWGSSPGRHVQTENMVNLPGMLGYSAVFSAALLVTQAFGLFIARQGYRSVGWRPEIVLLFFGTGAGCLMAAHRLLVVAVPRLSGYGYSVVTWTLSLLRIAGYLCAALRLSMRRQSDVKCPAD